MSKLETDPGQEKLQHTWQCKTCGILGNKYICNACKERCHVGHDVVDTGIRNATCCCNEDGRECKATNALQGKEAEDWMNNIQTKPKPESTNSNLSSETSSDDDSSNSESDSTNSSSSHSTTSSSYSSSSDSYYERKDKHKRRRRRNTKRSRRKRSHHPKLIIVPVIIPINQTFPYYY